MLASAIVDEADCGEPVMRINQSILSELPYRHIGALISVDGLTTNHGTGILISRNLVLTCAHNVINLERKILFKKIYFYPGQHGLLTKAYEV
jgi:V8-like Glu-specific endopeptidase